MVTPDVMSAGVSLSERDWMDEPWLAFVGSHPDATAFHHPAWMELLADTYGYRPSVLALTDPEGEVAAGVPLLEVRSWLAGSRFVSLPFTDHCPPLSRDAETLAGLSARFAEWSVSDGVRRLEIRGTMPEAPGVIEAVVGVRHVLPLEGDSRQIRSRFKPERGKGVRKAERDGVDVRLTRTRDGLAAFYRLHCLTRRKLGVPVQPARFFEGLWRKIIDRNLGHVLLAYRSGQPIAGAVLLTWNGQLILKYSASDPSQLRFRPNNLVVWAAIDWGCRNGCRQMDFGKTDLDDTGLRAFKLGWASTEVPLSYCFVGTEPPKPRTGLARRTASRMIRVSPPVVARGVGELFYRHLA